MKFVDEAFIRVEAGAGGNGCLSFLRAKFVPKGGPNGGDGGHGGTVSLIGDIGLNTLVDFRYRRLFKAERGEHGRGNNCRGCNGSDLQIAVPLGTLVWQLDGVLLGEVMRDQEVLVIAQGGRRGLGNARFKSSIQRAPKRTTTGYPGESLDLRLELRILADVGLLGLPNAGKSTLLRSVSAATPKVAAYPFTTRYPSLGVINAGLDTAFHIADIPGLLPGAHQGIGLGVQFLNHLARTRLLLHLVDIGECWLTHCDPLSKIDTIEQELRHFGKALAKRERWIVLNQIDRIPATERAAYIDSVRARLEQKNWFPISGICGASCAPLMRAITHYLHPNETQ